MSQLDKFRNELRKHEHIKFLQPIYDNLHVTQSSATQEVIRFVRDSKPCCVVVTIGFVNALDIRSAVFHIVALIDLGIHGWPEDLPNGAEVPLWITEKDAVDLVPQDRYPKVRNKRMTENVKRDFVHKVLQYSW